MKILLSSIAVLMLISGCATHSARTSMLQTGMTENEVRTHLGQPDQIDNERCRSQRIRCIVLWDYGRTRVSLSAPVPGYTLRVDGWRKR